MFFSGLGKNFNTELRKDTTMKYRRFFAVCYIAILIPSTIALYAQSRPYVPEVTPAVLNVDSEVINAIQNQRLDQVDKNYEDATKRMDTLQSSVSDLAGSMNRFTGIGIGIGVTLTVLQALQLILQVRKNQSATERRH